MHQLATQASQNVDLMLLIPVFVGLGVGLLLWTAGRRVLRFGFVLMGMTIGAGVGYIIGLGWVDQVQPWVVATVGGLVLGGFAFMFYKMFVASVFAAIIGICLPVLAGVAHDNGIINMEAMFGGADTGITQLSEDEETDDNAGADEAADGAADSMTADADAELSPEPTTEELRDQILEHINNEQWGDAATIFFSIDPEKRQKLLDAADIPDEHRDDAQFLLDFMEDPMDASVHRATDSLPEETKQQIMEEIDQVRERLALSDKSSKELNRISGNIRTLIIDKWDSVRQEPSGVQTGMLAAAVIGAAIGLFVGVAASGFSAFVVTAIMGAMFMLLSGWLVLCEFDRQDLSWLPTSSNVWLVVWLVTAFIGFMIQWTFRTRRTDKSR